jgi:heme/copper-type cytochrome/quinol oxidase subunit 4
MGFFGRWFGFEGWKRLNGSQRILQQIAYRIGFVIGLAIFVIAYVMICKQDPTWELIPIILVWFLIYQALLNFIFVQGSR